MTHKFILAFLIGSLASAAMAATPEEIREMIDAGSPAEAADAAREALADESNARFAGQFNELLGEALFMTPGKKEEARQYLEEAKRRGVADASLYLGRLAMLNYDFPSAQRLYGEYKSLKKKASKPLDDEFEYNEAELKEALTQWQRVREIVVIDAVNVNRNDFFNHIRIPASAGRLLSTDKLPLPQNGIERCNPAFTSESGDLLLWSEVNDSTGMLQIMEASRLTDGSLSTPTPAPEFLNQEGDAAYPFLSADGTTLYYAANGDNSIGGFDIFMATRDPLTGDYLQPVNAGIPFNSAADDYMMAIDEENGVGWWATDRHSLLDDKITLYVYILPEARVNLDCSDEEKRERSLLTDIRVTWNPPVADPDDDDEDDDEITSADEEDEETLTPEERAREYSALAAEIRKITPGQRPRGEDCRIPLRNGKYIYGPEDVATPEQRAAVEQYIVLAKAQKAAEAKLAEMRRSYAANPSTALGREVAAQEKLTEQGRTQLTNHLSQLYRFLGYK